MDNILLHGNLFEEFKILLPKIMLISELEEEITQNKQDNIYTDIDYIYLHSIFYTKSMILVHELIELNEKIKKIGTQLINDVENNNWECKKDLLESIQERINLSQEAVTAFDECNFDSHDFFFNCFKSIHNQVKSLCSNNIFYKSCHRCEHLLNHDKDILNLCWNCRFKLNKNIRKQ
jgi:hypothetical protein